MIFDGDLEIAQAAGVRWRDREATRQANHRDIAAGDIPHTETPERIKLRLDRLAMAATQTVLTVTEPSLAESLGLERMLGTPDFRNVNFLEFGTAVARYTGRINIRSGADRTVGFGTGFMVSPQLMLTNNHVLSSSSAAKFSEIEFDYQYDSSGTLVTPVPFRLRPELFFVTDERLDFTLVAVAEVSEAGIKARNYGWTQLIGTQGKILVGENVNIIQHPKGQAKQIAFRDNELVDLLADFAHYTTDTEPGSSGSPVYNDQWDLVALHHSGVPRMVDGNHVKKDGSRFMPGDDPNDLDWVANEGIRVSSIVKHIEALTLDPAQARLREEMLTELPPSPIAAAREAAREAAAMIAALTPPTTPAPPVPMSPAVAATTMSWTIPLTVTVQLGVPVVSAGAPVATAVASPAPAPQPDLVAALDEAARSAARAYYDATTDAPARDAYYARLAEPIDRLDPAAAFASLSALVRDTHSRKLAYRPAVHLYPTVDLQEGAPPTVASIYSGKRFAAATFIEQDFATEEMLAAAGPEAALLEAQHPFNCEHVVPQSWFAKKEPMRGDLHHLFACESDCNSFRGNVPYFDFPDFEEVIRGDCGKRETNRFEPADGKGAVARATLYFLLRYPGEIDATGEFTADRLPILLDWHKRFPAGRWEQHRNAAIFAKQGNRNPLIDFPAWATAIDFARGLGTR